MASNFGNMPVDNMSSMDGEQTGLDAQFDKMVQTRQSMAMPDWQSVPYAKPGSAPAAPQQSDEALMGPPYNPNGARVKMMRPRVFPRVGQPMVDTVLPSVSPPACTSSGVTMRSRTSTDKISPSTFAKYVSASSPEKPDFGSI